MSPHYGENFRVQDDYSARIRALRIAHELTQMRLADLLGVAFATVNRWENGQSKPSPMAWQQILRIERFGMDAFQETREEKPMVRETGPTYNPSGVMLPDFTTAPEVVRIVAEAHRLTYGHLFNPAFATEISRIDPLPHQRIIMSNSLFQNGGPYHTRRTSGDEYSMNIPIPKDPDGRVARACPSNSCSPGYFKVTLGTGLIGQEKAFCPYCRHVSEPSDFATKEQIRYAKNIALREMQKGMDGMIKDAFGLGSSGRKTYGGGMISLEVSYKPGTLPYIHGPFEEELRRDVVCPFCTLDHSVFGLAVWCPDCGRDIFMTHVQAEFAVLRKVLADVDRRRKELGVRVAAKDVENCLEDTVSIYEAVLRFLITRKLREKGTPEDEIEQLFAKTIRNALQSITRSQEIVREYLGLELFQGIQPDVVEQLCATFEKRHPITHNLGIVDKKYLDKIRSGEREGRDVRITVQEIESAMAIVFERLTHLHNHLFPAPSSDVPILPPVTSDIKHLPEATATA